VLRTCSFIRFSPKRTVLLENSTPIVCCEYSLTTKCYHGFIQKTTGEVDIQELCVNWCSRQDFPVPASPASSLSLVERERNTHPRHTDDDELH
jgi:hypothetical protein